MASDSIKPHKRKPRPQRCVDDETGPLTLEHAVLWCVSMNATVKFFPDRTEVIAHEGESHSHVIGMTDAGDMIGAVVRAATLLEREREMHRDRIAACGTGKRMRGVEKIK